MRPTRRGFLRKTGALGTIGLFNKQNLKWEKQRDSTQKTKTRREPGLWNEKFTNHAAQNTRTPEPGDTPVTSHNYLGSGLKYLGTLQSPSIDEVIHSFMLQTTTYGVFEESNGEKEKDKVVSFGLEADISGGYDSELKTNFITEKEVLGSTMNDG